MTLSEKRSLMACDCTLNGRPAIILGAMMPFAHVVTLNGKPQLSAEFAWPTVARIIAADGRFTS